MKKHFIIQLLTTILISISVLFSMSSCEKAPQGNLLTGDEELEALVEDAQYNIIEEKEYTVEELADLLYGPEGADLDNADLRKKFIENNYLANDDIDQGFAPANIIYHYEYESKDQLGYPITLSAFMSVGAVNKARTWFTDQDNIYLICPYTHTKEDECATKDKGGFEFKLFLFLDNMFIMPDGQGFGSNANNVQPYVDHKTQARQIYDAMKAGFKLYVDKGGHMESDFKLRVIGASQGGGDAIAVHKLLDTTYETHYLPWPYKRDVSKLAGEWWQFEYSYVCCGPYCPEVTMQTYHEWTKVTYPCVIPLVIKSMRACNPEFAKKYEEEKFFSEKWNGHKEDFDKIYREKTMNSADLNCYICEKLGLTVKDRKNPPAVPLTTMLSKEMNDTNSPIYKDLMECLKKQDLTSGWTPKTKTYVVFSENDEVVPYANTKKLFDLFKNKCEKEELGWGHVGCCRLFMTYSW